MAIFPNIKQRLEKGLRNTQHNDNYHNDIQYIDALHEGLIHDTQHTRHGINDPQHNKNSTIMLSVNMLSVEAP